MSAEKSKVYENNTLEQMKERKYTREQMLKSIRSKSFLKVIKDVIRGEIKKDKDEK
jgi:hypothetical protein